MRATFLCSLASASLGFVMPCRAESVVLTPVADTTLIQLMPDNNMGGHVFFNAGTTFNGHRNRALLRFDPAGVLPTGSRITSAQLVVEVVGIPVDEPAGGNFRLHRVLRPWGEGNKDSDNGPGPGRGDTATEGEATWNSRFAFSTNTWATPGGAAGVDYSAIVSAEQFVEVVDDVPYGFGSSAQTVADVQLWLDSPGENHGWLLKAEVEEVTTTARRFASREDPDFGPQLHVEFIPPPKLNVAREGGELRLSFAAQPEQAYTLEQTDSLEIPVWNTLTNIPASPSGESVDLTNQISGSAVFFRLKVEE